MRKRVVKRSSKTIRKERGDDLAEVAGEQCVERGLALQQRKELVKQRFVREHAVVHRPQIRSQHLLHTQPHTRATTERETEKMHAPTHA